MESEMFDRVGEILRSTAESVVMPRFTALSFDDIAMKGVDDPVTIADREAEAMIRCELELLLPGSRVVGEEACATDLALLDRLDEGKVWIVDPIDGTANFAAGRPPFAMMIALLEQGELVGSWILNPLSDRLIMAQRGAGTWIDGERIRVNAGFPSIGKINGIVSQAFLPSDQEHLIDRIRAAVTVVQTARCAGHEYPLVAFGWQHFALYWRTLVWDHAPGVLLLTEAGGSVMHLDGSPYVPCRSQPGLLLAHNSGIADFLIEMIARPS
jgi:fructose-1,6-bisphosphatase/inositol monophosphatase family enzyme